MKLLKTLLTICLVAALSSGYAQLNEDSVSYQVIVESTTPAILGSILQSAKKQNIAQQNMGQIMQWAALQLLGKPYAPALLDRHLPEYLYISLNQTDCMLFIEEVFALSKMIKNHQQTISDLTNWILQVRYNKSSVSYCSRNHYFKSWALANIEQGFMTDVASSLTLQYLPFSAHVLGDKIASYKPILASAISTGSQNRVLPLNHVAELDCIRVQEKNIDKQQLGFIPLNKIPKYLSEIKSGDIIGIVRIPTGGADSIHHLGIAYVHNGDVSMIDASSIYNKVVIESSLLNYMSKFNDALGIILIRAQ